MGNLIRRKMFKELLVLVGTGAVFAGLGYYLNAWAIHFLLAGIYVMGIVVIVLKTR